MTKTQRWIPLIFVFISVLVFLPHLTRNGVFVGDSDRMNHSLTVLKAFVDGFKEGRLPFWNETQFGGYSLVALPYQYPNPVPLLAAALGVTEIFRFAGYEAAILLALTGFTAYGFLRENGRSVLASVVGGVLYETSALTILKVSQNDMSFLVITLIPVLLLLIRRTAGEARPAVYLGLFLVAAVLLNFCFLQKASYAGLLTGAYAVWLAVTRRTWVPVVMGGLAALPSVVIAVPRLLTVAQDFGQATRYHAEGGPDTFAVAYSVAFLPFPNILRWFDERIFGGTFQQMNSLGNSLNLHEGVLLYVTSFAPFLILALAIALVRKRLADRDAWFFLTVVVFTFLVAFFWPVYWVVWQAFGKIDFIHSRIFLIAIISEVMLVALAIDAMQDMAESTCDVPRQGAARRWGMPFMLGIGVSLGIEWWVSRLPMSGMSLSSETTLQNGALVRIIFAAVSLFLAWAALRWRWRPRFLQKQDIPVLLSGLIVAQAVVYAVLSVWGPDRWAYPTVFKAPTNVMAAATEFRTPSEEAKRAVRETLESDRYRVAIVCRPEVTSIFCASQVSNFWGLRSIDGYVSSLPRRLAVMPWGSALSLRAIAHVSADQLNWPLLGLLNVKYALPLVPGLMTNDVIASDGGHRELQPKDLIAVANPLPVAERVFFVKSVRAVANMGEGVKALFPGGLARKEGYFPEQESYVEGWSSDRAFPTDGQATALFRGTHDEILITPSDHERFLVVNERYDENWMATDGSGLPLRIYPTDLFMRGVVVPAGADKVLMDYRPFMARREAFAFYAVGLVMAAAVFTVLVRRQ